MISRNRTMAFEIVSYLIEMNYEFLPKVGAVPCKGEDILYYSEKICKLIFINKP